MTSDRNEVPVYIGMGSNLCNPREQLECALAAIRQLPQSRLLAVSPLYDSAPVGPQDQPRYMNAVVKLATLLSPMELLRALQDIEKAQGRVRSGEQWGPRTLDLDVLLYGDQLIDEEALVVPHPRLAERAFALCPLCDLDPDLMIPGQGKLSPMVQALSRGDTVKIGHLCER